MIKFLINKIQTLNKKNQILIKWNKSFLNFVFFDLEEEVGETSISLETKI